MVKLTENCIERLKINKISILGSTWQEIQRATIFNTRLDFVACSIKIIRKKYGSKLRYKLSRNFRRDCIDDSISGFFLDWIKLEASLRKYNIFGLVAWEGLIMSN